MAIFAILNFLLGAVLGHRFKIQVLLPTIVVSAIVAIGIGIARADDAWLIGLTVTLASVCLQIGYLCGTVTSAPAVASRAEQIRDHKFGVQIALGHAKSISTDPYENVGIRSVVGDGHQVRH